MSEKPDIRVLVGVEGGASIDGKSGQLITKELTKIAAGISSQKAPKVTFNIDSEKTLTNIQNQLNTIVKSIKINPIDLNIQSKQSSVGNFAEDEYRKLIDSTKGKKAKANLIAHIQEKQGLADVIVQKTKDVEVTKKQQKAVTELSKALQFLGSADEEKALLQADNLVNKLGRTDIAPQLETLKTTALKLKSEMQKVKSEIGDNLSFDDLAKKMSDPEALNEIKKTAEDVQTYSRAVVDFQKSVGSTVGSFNKELRNADNGKLLDNLILKVTKFEKVNDKFKNNSGLAAEFERIKNALNNLKIGKDFSKVDIDKLDRQFSEFKTNVVSLGQEGQTAFGKLRAQMEKLGVYLSASAIMMGAWREVKDMINNVIELDAKVTDLQIATGYTRQETEKLLITYSQMGKQLGATTVDVANAADAWLRQGYSIEESNTLIKNSMMLSKLGQIDSADATKALTSAMKGYKLSVEDSIGVVDKFTSLDMEAAVSAGYIATAMAETSTGARLAGVEMDKLAGYITQVGEVTQDGAESVGVFFKTLFARMGNIKEGKLIDPETQEDLSAVEVTLDNLGIKLRENGGEFRNFGTILDEVYSKWNTLGSVNQRALAVAFSGVRNQEKFLTLMDNYGQAMEYAEVAANSAGTALDKYENSYLASVEAAQNNFTAQFETLSKAIVNSELIKGTYNTGSGLLGALSWIIDTLGAIPTLAIAASGAISALSNKGRLGQVLVSQYLNKYALLWLIGDDERVYSENGAISKSHIATSLKWCA